MNTLVMLVSVLCYFVGFSFLCLSLFAYLLGDWRGDRGQEVKERMIIRLSFSIAFSLIATFLLLMARL
jgi:hypothetical protein